MRSSDAYLYCPFSDGTPYIAAGVRQSIQDDFSRPIEAAVKGPMQELTQATYHARIVMAEVHKESRFQTWTWLGIMVLLGVLLGAAGCFYFVQRDIGRIADRLDSIQQQITPATPVPAVKLGTPAKSHRGR